MKVVKKGKPVIVLCSGGMDSVTLAYQVHSIIPTPEMVLFGVNYGQRHNKELQCANQVARDLGVPYVCALLEQPIEITFSSTLVKEGADVPEGHYTAEENMKVTVVPNRSAILFSLAWAHAVAIGATTIYAAMHAGDHRMYPDCRPVFIDALNEALRYGTKGHADPKLAIITPYISLAKRDIIRIGAKQLEVLVPYEKTWSCYKGGELHCGRCGDCVERKETFHLALVDDPTRYEDPTPFPDKVNF